MSESDYVNLIKVSRKYKDLLMFFRYNPISDTTLFPMIQTQHFYKRDDTRYKIPDMTHYIHWYEVDQNEWMARSHLDTYKSVTLQNHGISLQTYPSEELDPTEENIRDENITYDSDDEKLWNCPLPIVKGVCTVPEGINKLGPHCFDFCSGVSKIELPSTLREIGDYAFSGTSIIDIKIPEGVTSVGKSCFCQCFDLDKIKFPRTLKVIGDSCVYICGTVIRVKIPRDCIVGEDGLEDVNIVDYY